jgi:hypothetical protein
MKAPVNHANVVGIDCRHDSETPTTRVFPRSRLHLGVSYIEMKGALEDMYLQLFVSLVFTSTKTRERFHLNMDDDESLGCDD